MDKDLKRIKELMGIDNKLLPISEKAMHRILDVHNDNGYIIISAYRGERSPAENRSKHLELMQDVKNSGFSFMKMYGGFIENKGTDEEQEVQEPALFIPNFPIGKTVPFPNTDKIKDMGIALSKKYNQDSFLFKDKDKAPAYIDKNGGVDMEFNGDFIINKGEEEYFTKLHKNNNGRFTLSENIYVCEPPKTINGRHSTLLKTGESFFSENIIKL